MKQYSLYINYESVYLNIPLKRGGDRMEIPQVGSIIQIKSLKHNNTLHRCWEQNIVLYSDENTIIGGNNKTIVEEATGKKWRTKEPAIFYFNRQYWFNVIKIFGETESYYYCNLSSPYTYKSNSLQYIDYELDIIVHADWSYKVVDQMEYDVNKYVFKYPHYIQNSIEKNLTVLKRKIENRRDPFNDSFIHYWYEIFLDIHDG